MTDPVRVLVLSDTHLPPHRADALPSTVAAELARVDVILHAGDVVCGETLDALRAHAPVHAVLGNNDRGLERTLPDRLELDLGGVAVAMVHDAGARSGRPARLHRWFPGAQVVVFGHSHEPVDEEGIDGQRLFNPGSPTQRRRQSHPTLGILRLGSGRVLEHRIVVGDR